MKQYKTSDKVASAFIDALVVMITVVAVIIVSVLGSFFGLTYHYTSGYDYSLSGSTDELFKEAIDAGKKVKIYFCMSDADLRAHSTGSEVYTTALMLEEKYDDFIDIEHINIITRQDEDGNLFPLSKYERDENNKVTRIYKTSVIFECGDNYRVITDTYTAAGFAPFFTLDSSLNDTAYNGEEVMSAMISWVTVDPEERKHAYFTKFHGEVADIAFSNLLTCAGYYIHEIDLRKEEVPANADLLVISNPTSDFETSRDGSVRCEMDRLRDYLDGGGNLYVAIDPLVKRLSVLEGLLAEYGIEFDTTTLSSGKTVRNIVKDPSNAITLDGFTIVADYASTDLGGRIANRVNRYSDGGVIVRQVAALKLSAEKNAKPLLVSSSSSVLEAGGSEVSSEGNYALAAYSEKQTENGGAARIFVIPSVYLAVSDSLIAREYSNKDFTYGLFDEFFGADNMPYGCNAVVYDTTTLEGLTMGTAKLYVALILLVPISLAVYGTVRIVRRRNR